MVASRGGFDLMPEQGNKPVNKYLPPRTKTSRCASQTRDDEVPDLVSLAQNNQSTGILGWLDRTLDAIS